MEDVRDLFDDLLSANRRAFERELFKVAYHTLSGAMYCALSMEDGLQMKQVEQLARAQFQAVKASTPSARPYPSSEPHEVGLYASLIEISATRAALLRDDHWDQN